MIFNAESFWDNIYKIIKEQGKKIGEVEKSLHVSKGHLSRQSKDKSSPDIKLVLELANILEVHFSELLIYPQASLTANEKHLMKFLDKVISDTENDKINWHPETPNESYPLVSKRGNKNVHIDSKFSPECDVKLLGNIYTGYVERIEQEIVIFKCRRELPKDVYGDLKIILNNMINQYFEMYFVNGKDIVPICTTPELCREIVEKVEILYSMARQYCSSLSLNDEAKTIMSEFLMDYHQEE